MHLRGHIVTERTGTDEKRIRVGRALKRLKFINILTFHRIFTLMLMIYDL